MCHKKLLFIKNFKKTMSKRSISRKICTNNINFPLPESSNLPNSRKSVDKCIQEIYFGEKITNSETCSSSNASEQFNTSSDELRDIVSCSGSSISGEDDLEIDAAKRVTKEFEKVNSILYEKQKGEATNDIEYKQWTEKFPHLRILAQAMKIHPCSENECSSEGGDGDYFEEIIAEHSDCTCSSSTDKFYNKSKIKEAVINSVLKEVSSKLKKRQDCKIIVTSPAPRRKEKARKHVYENDELESIEVNEVIPTSENFLQITAATMPLLTSPFRQPNFEYQSPIMKSHLSASKWQRQDSVDYASLPYLSNTNVPYTNNEKRSHGSFSANKSDIVLNRSATSSRNRSDTFLRSNKINPKKFVSTPRSNKNVILPPIQNLNLDGESAVPSTPRKYSRCHK